MYKCKFYTCIYCCRKRIWPTSFPEHLVHASLKTNIEAGDLSPKDEQKLIRAWYDDARAHDIL